MASSLESLERLSEHEHSESLLRPLLITAALVRFLLFRTSENTITDAVMPWDLDLEPRTARGARRTRLLQLLNEASLAAVELAVELPEGVALAHRSGSASVGLRASRGWRALSRSPECV